MLHIIYAPERFGVVSKQKSKYIGIGQNELKNIGISAKIQPRASLVYRKVYPTPLKPIII